MPFDLRELKQVMRAALLNDAAVVGIADQRVRTSHVRAADESTSFQPTVIMDFRGGGARFASAPVQARTMFLYGYSNISQDQALELYQAAATVLHREGVSHPNAGQPGCPTVCAYGLETSAPLEDWNEVMGAWFARGTWQVWGQG